MTTPTTFRPFYHPALGVTEPSVPVDGWQAASREVAVAAESRGEPVLARLEYFWRVPSGAAGADTGWLYFDGQSHIWSAAWGRHQHGPDLVPVAVISDHIYTYWTRG